MNKPVAPWTGTKGLHKEKKAIEIAKKHKTSEKSLKKSVRKVAVRLAERKHSKEDLHEAHKHMKKHGG